MNEISKALMYSSLKHKNQRRKDKDQTPYINHPITVMNILITHNINDKDVLIGALLHDIIEDTSGTFEEIEEQFNKKIAEIVLDCSDNKSLSKTARKQQQIEKSAYKSLEAKLVKMADKIANINSLNNEKPETWSDSRVLGYIVWSKKVMDTIKSSNISLYETFLTMYNLLMFEYNIDKKSEDQILIEYYNLLDKK